jgi:hypothetical protein
MTKKDSERNKKYSNQPNLSNGNGNGKFSIGFFTFNDNKSKTNPDENLIKTFKETKSEFDPNISYEKKIGKDTKFKVGMSSKGKGFIKIKKTF